MGFPPVGKPGRPVKMKVLSITAAILAVGIFALSGGAKLGNKGLSKERSDMFKTNGVSYPIRLANYQGNSLVGATATAKGTRRWSREYRAVDEQFLLVPQAVLIRGDYVGVQSTGDLLVYDADGNFKFQVGIGQNTPVIFGAEAIAFLTSSGLLEYRDYANKVLLEAKEVPAFREWAYVLLMKPGADDLLAAIQFSGGPQRKPQEYDIYSVPIEKTTRSWSHNGQGHISRVLLSPDGATIYMLKECKVTLLSVVDGRIAGQYDLPLSRVTSASLDNAGNLVVTGASDGDNPKDLLAVFGPDGKALWTYALQNYGAELPPSCRDDGGVIIVDGSFLRCVRGGDQIWEQPLPGEAKTWVTIDAAGNVACINGPYLKLIDNAGNKIFDLTLTNDNEVFNAPPAIDARGRIYVAGSEKLYCIE